MKVELKNIGKKYEGRTEYTLDNINLSIQSKEFIAILGPSGCGKTTLLRMIAGLNSITKGDLLFDGKRVNEISPADRKLSMVFQSYALYPQMTVYKNIAYGLEIRKVRKDIVDYRVRGVADVLQISEYLHNKPSDLSGGQRQRVAIGRAIARKPKLFLMDEPLSNLDAKLREKMRKEIVEIHQMVGSTTIYVTHDQLEAMTMASKIVLLDGGVIQQFDKPINLYNKPANIFVAKFIGSPTMNFFEGRYANGEFVSNEGGVKLKISHKFEEEREITLGFRSETLTVVPATTKNATKVKVTFIENLGKEQQIFVSIPNGKEIVASVNQFDQFKVGQTIHLSINEKGIHYFDSKTTKRIEVKGKKS